MIKNCGRMNGNGHGRFPKYLLNLSDSGIGVELEGAYLYFVFSFLEFGKLTISKEDQKQTVK